MDELEAQMVEAAKLKDLECEHERLSKDLEDLRGVLRAIRAR